MSLLEVERTVRELNKAMSIRMESGIDIFDGRRVWFVRMTVNTTAVTYTHTETCRPEEPDEIKGNLAQTALDSVVARFMEGRT